MTSLEQVQRIADMAPKPTPKPGNNGRRPHTGHASRLDVARWLSDRGVEHKTKAVDGGMAYLVACPFDANHGGNGESAIVQADSGMLTYHCKHNSCQDRRWADCRDAVGRPDPSHYDPPLGSPTTTSKAAKTRTPQPADTVLYCTDRNNFGYVIEDTGGDSIYMLFKPEGGSEAKVHISIAKLRKQDGSPLDGTGPIIPPPICLPQLVTAYPTLRPAVIQGLLRIGETANMVAAPKQGKSWLVNGLAVCVAAGLKWLDTFRCTQGRVLIIDGELHPEVIAHRLPAVTAAMGIGAEALGKIDVLPLRGLGANLGTLGPFLLTIEPGEYVLIILDAWYRFLPPGLSESDNAQVMALYNKIDSYTAHLKSAWVNVHHASKGDQSGKGVTDVGSGAGSQSRAADTHLIIRPHDIEGVAVLEAVVRSFLPVEPLAIRWEFPTWALAAGEDPRRLANPRRRQTQRTRGEDRQAIVNLVYEQTEPRTKTFLRNLADGIPMGHSRFDRAFDSLVADGTLRSGEGRGKQGQKREVWALKPDDES